MVPDNQLSLAIGKRGQNARLAARLTKYKIDIKSESEMEELQNQEDAANDVDSDATDETDRQSSTDAE